MDVTSLLNSGSGAVVEGRDSLDFMQTPSAMDSTTPSTTPLRTPSPEKTLSRRSSDSRGKITGRTPWDAGGYSLPLNIDTKGLHSNPKTAYYLSESPIDATSPGSPKSPKHKSSDSQSSFSSYASSSNSVSHSRISSLSTVSEYQPLNYHFTMMEKISDPPSTVPCHPTFVEVSPPTPVLEESPARYNDGSQSSSDDDSAETLRRPQSPSDALMITRLISSERRHSHKTLGVPYTKLSHKRAISAPSFPTLATMPFHKMSGKGKSVTSDNMGDVLEVEPQASESRAPDAAVDGEQEPFPPGNTVCIVPDCTLGSDWWRKAVSHIFGRNKTCTRQIPEEVWAQYCRKHYQRRRYKGAAAYVQHCFGLVQQQIDRIQLWSDYNERHGKPGVVTGWEVAIRKREKERRDQEAKTSRKRSIDDVDQEYGPGADDADDEPIPRASATTDNNETAVPDWVIEKNGQILPTPEILDIVRRLGDDIAQRGSSQLPDIEILPQIAKDETKKAKASPRRRKSSIAGAHKRSKSMGQTLSTHQPHLDKRQRIDSAHLSVPQNHGMQYFAPAPVGPPNSGLDRPRPSHQRSASEMTMPSSEFRPFNSSFSWPQYSQPSVFTQQQRVYAQPPPPPPHQEYRPYYMPPRETRRAYAPLPPMLHHSEYMSNTVAPPAPAQQAYQPQGYSPYGTVTSTSASTTPSLGEPVHPVLRESAAAVALPSAPLGHARHRSSPAVPQMQPAKYPSSSPAMQAAQYPTSGMTMTLPHHPVGSYNGGNQQQPQQANAGAYTYGTQTQPYYHDAPPRAGEHRHGHVRHGSTGYSYGPGPSGTIPESRHESS